MSYWYLGSPYTRYEAGISAAAFCASYETALLIKAGVPVFSPVVHSHKVAYDSGLDPLDHAFWMAVDRPFMEAAKGLIVCRMEGWKESYGISMEIQAFQAMRKPIIFMDPGEVPAELLKRKQVIGLCGYATSGKDTAAKGLMQEGWERVSLADGLREALLALDPYLLRDPEWPGYDVRVSGEVRHSGWNDAKKEPEVRRLLQRMGTEAGRDIHGQDCWVNIARRKIDATDKNVVVTDVRFENEAAMIRSYGGKLVWVERPGVGPVNGHVSDAGLAKLKEQADLIITNDSTEEALRNKLAVASNLSMEAVA